MLKILQIAFLIFFTINLYGVQLVEPKLFCRATTLVDVQSGRVLLDKNGTLQIPPASMTKLMTIHLAMKKVKAGEFTLEQKVPVSKRGSFKSAPVNSSLMFVEEGQIVSLKELLLGLSVSSGNDAAVVVAELVAGTLEAFVVLMNEEVKTLGLTSTQFFDSSGYDNRNVTTAADFAKFATFYVNEYPENLTMFHSVQKFAYPKPENIAERQKPAIGLVEQTNKNILLGKVDGVDGLKTGFIDESGFNIAITANRDDRRLVAVVMGVPYENGAANRYSDAKAILSYGYDNFENYVPVPPSFLPLRVYKGKSGRVAVEVADIPTFTRIRGEIEYTKWNIVLNKEPLVAPLAVGSKVGLAVYLDSENNVIFTRDIVTIGEVARGGLFKRVIDSIKLLFVGK